MAHILAKCTRCKEIFDRAQVRLDDKDVLLCAYCLEHVKANGKIIPPVATMVKQRACDNCKQIIFPHEYFFYRQDWEDISKSVGYFCADCVEKLYPADLKKIWTACQVYKYPVKEK